MITMVTTGNLLESIRKYQLDGIMNAANSVGPMGAGIAGAIRRYGGDEIESDAFKVCAVANPTAGEAYSTIAGQLKEKGIKRIIHAVTMKRPGSHSSLEIVEKAFSSALALAKAEKITCIGCTALGTGIGQLPKDKVAEIMVRIGNATTDINIVIMDFDTVFINACLLYFK